MAGTRITQLGLHGPQMAYGTWSAKAEAAVINLVYSMTLFVTTSYAQTLTVKATAGHNVSVTTTDSFTLRTA